MKTMSTLRFIVSTRIALIAALSVAALVATSHVSAGTQMPPWKYGSGSMTNFQLTTPGSQSQPVVEKVVETSEEQEKEEEYAPEMGGNGGQTPVAAPTPSAIAGGLALMGFLAGRRRKAE